MIQVTCYDITGHTRDELTALRVRATVRGAGPMSDDQKEAARQLLEAFAAFIHERAPVPTDIRMAVADIINRGDNLAAANSAENQDQTLPRFAA